MLGADFISPKEWKMPPLWTLYLIISISGACVLSIEILGTRVLGPYYGVSLFLWSALITVTLAALSLGYLIGGRWADRDARFKNLAIMLGGAGLWIVLVPWLKRPILDLLTDAGMRTAVLVASTILFAPPLTLLGMVSPYAIRLKAQSLEEVGRTAGELFAFSTLASVVSAVATGFWLIPVVGVFRLLLGIGLLLIGTAVFTLLLGRGGARLGLGVLLLVGISSLATFAPASYPAPASHVRFLGQSPYAQIRVLDRPDARYLLIDGGTHSISDYDDFESWHPYAAVVDLMKAYFDAPGDMLLVGLGGGSVALSYERAGWEVDAVEIDPLVADVAREWFGLAETKMAVHLEDGRAFLNRGEEQFDLMILDAFGSSSIPFHLITEEVFALAKTRMADGGVLAINLESIGWKHPLVLAVAETLRQSFAHVVALPIAEPPSALGNVILVATDREDIDRPEDTLEHPQDFLHDDGLHYRVLERFHAWNNRFEPSRENAAVLTDDLNPSDLWAEEINRVAREDLLNYFTPAEYGW
jgi:spermidine synthase